MATTTNMELVLATVSTTLGPEWAELINEAFEKVDLHDHTEGKGVKVPSAGLNINDDLDMNGETLLDSGALQMRSLAAALTSILRSMQVVNGDLYYVNGAGTAVQVTSGSSVVSTGSGALSLTTPGAYPYSVTSANAQTVVLVDTTAARTINLPAATTAITFYLKDSDGTAQTNNITVVPDGTDTVDGANANYIIDYDDALVGFISDGVSAWWVI